MEIIETILTAITKFLSGIGNGIVSVFEKLVFEHTVEAGTDGVIGTADDIITKTSELSSLAIWGLTFVGLAFAVGLFYKLFNKVR